MLRPALIALVLLSACLHALGMARSDLPAQDGLKFIRVARQFHERPWAEVVRGTDQHPLYPALIAASQPAAALIFGPGPDGWRIAAQLVSALASLALLVPLHGIIRHLFDETVADRGVLLWVLLPLPGMIGHDTLSDPTALLAFATCWRCGQLVLAGSHRWAVVGCGLAAGVGYLARPEILIAPFTLAIVGLGSRLFRPGTATAQALSRYGVVMASCLFVVGGYALVKGEVSEKLALRRTAALPPSAAGLVSTNKLPKGLDTPEWDFSPKEETGRTIAMGPAAAFLRMARSVAELLAGVVAILALYGLWRGRVMPERRLAALAMLAYTAIFGAILVRHATIAGYLSARHTLTLGLLAIPWAAAGLHRLGQHFQARPFLRMGVLGALIAAAVVFQARQGHPSRWGHRAAGAWLAAHAEPGGKILDTRGWAAFVSGRPAYTPWQIGQALKDPRLDYVVVGADELAAPTRRARSLRAILDASGTLVAGFPERKGHAAEDILVYRFRPRDSWEGLTP